MLTLALFAIAAIGGLILAGLCFSGRPYPPLALALVHGAFAAAGLIALIISVTGAGASTLATVALVLFLVAAGGGFVMFSRHLRKIALPRPLIIVHALAAVAGFVLLVIATLSS